MDEQLKQRLVGAAVLSLVGAIFLPLMFGNPKDPRSSIQASFDGTPAPNFSPQPTAAALPALVPQVQMPRRPILPPPTELAVTTPKPMPVASPAKVAQAKPLPAATAAPKPAVPEKSQTPAASGWILQLASYRQLDAAEGFLKRLRKDGYEAYRETIRVGAKKYYRVRMGLSMSKAEALALQKKLEKKYRLQAQLLEAR